MRGSEYFWTCADKNIIKEKEENREIKIISGGCMLGRGPNSIRFVGIT